MGTYREESYERYMAGDDGAFTDLVRDYRDGLILYINTLVRDLNEAEELAEEVFFRIAIRRARFRGRSAFKTWLYAIGRNLSIDALRKKSRISDSSEEELPLLPDSEELERSVIRNEQKALVHRALAKLSPDYRQALYLTYIEGFSNAEAGRIMKKDRRQIENLVYRAKGSLKKELEKEGFVYEDL